MVKRLGGARLLVLSTMMAGSTWLTGCGDDSSGTSDDAGTDAFNDGGGRGDGSLLTDGSNPDTGSPDTGVPDGGRPDTGVPDGGSEGGTEGGTGTGAARFATDPIDFGLADCGGSAASKTLVIQNAGTSALTVNPTTTGTAFAVTPATLTVAAGQSGTLTITATVPGTATAAAALNGTLTVKTSDAANASKAISLAVTPQGAVLAFAAGSDTSAAFGTAKLNAAAPTKTLTLKNNGNKSAQFAFAAPGNAQFSLSTAPASPATLAANATLTITAGFTPTSQTASQSQSAVTVTGAVCAGSVSSIPFSGQGTVGSVTGWPTAPIDFGAGTCGGAAPAAKTFTLSNAGGAPVAITSATFASTVGYTTDAAGKSVPAGGTLVVTITPPPIPSPSPIPGNYADTLTLRTDADATAHVINVTESAQGAILAFDTGASAGFGAFGTVAVGQTANQTFSIVNSGTAPAALALAGSGQFSVSSPTFTLAAGSAQAETLSFAPQSIAPQTGTLTLTAPQGGVCQPLPAPLALSGQGLNGGIGISTTSLAFSAFCGSAAAAQTFTITNTGNQPMTWAGAFGRTGAAALYTADVTGSTVQPGQSVTVTVTPKAIPAVPTSIAPSDFGDVFAITTNIVGDSTHLITASQVPLGAVLRVTPSALPFGNVPQGATSPSQPLVVTNVGNAGSGTATVALASSNNLFTLDQTSLGVAPGGSGTSNVAFVPTTAGAQTGNVTLSTAAPLCAPVPGPFATSGTGTTGPVLANENPMVFGAVDCGGTASAQTRTILNGGFQDFTVTSITLGKGDASPFTLTVTPASRIALANSATGVDYTVTPKPIPQNVTSALLYDATAFSDTLTFTTNAPGDVASHAIPLSMSARGVILGDVATTWNFGSSSTFLTSVVNSGNVPTTLNLTVKTYPTVFSLTPTTLNPSSNGTATNVSATFAGAPATAYSDTGTLSLSAPSPGQSVVLCQPLPASFTGTITLTGQRP